MCELAADENLDTKDWVVADPWESSQSKFGSSFSVAEHLDQSIKQHFPGIYIQVIFLCGNYL